jgi:hypothetical protein
MVSWKSTIQLADLHKAHQAGELTTSELGRTLAKRLRKSRYAGDLEGIAQELELVDDVDDYDRLLAALYDFGDRDHRIWINTFGP